MRKSLQNIVIFVTIIAIVVVIEHIILSILFTPIGMSIFFATCALLAVILWWPDISRRFPALRWQIKVMRPRSAIGHELSIGASNRFADLYPLIERVADSTKPTMLFGLSQRVLSVLGSESRHDIDYLALARKLDQLSIPYPPSGTTDNVRYSFLIQLAVLSKDDDIREARSLWANSRESSMVEIEEAIDIDDEALPFPEVQESKENE